VVGAARGPARLGGLMKPIQIDLARVADVPFWRAYELRRLERLLAYEPVCGPAHRHRAVLLAPPCVSWAWSPINRKKAAAPRTSSAAV